MARYKFDYVQIGKKKRPIIPVTLKSDEETVETLALIDSGADFNVFHSEIADTLKINLRGVKKQKFKGIGNKAMILTGNVAVVSLMIMQKGKNHKFNTPIVFTDEIPNNGYALLGETGFFDQLDSITFQYNKGKIYLDIDT